MTGIAWQLALWKEENKQILRCKGRIVGSKEEREEGRKVGRREEKLEGGRESWNEGRKEGVKESWKEGRIVGRKEERKEGRKIGRREGKLEGGKESWEEGRKEGGNQSWIEGRKEERKESWIVSQNFSFLFLFGSSITPSDHLPIRFVTSWRALSQTLMQNWQLMIRAKRLQVIGVILANQTEQT